MTPADRHVHIVDDDSAVRRSTAFLLGVNGFTTDQWESGTALLAGIDRATPGCILLDLRMPGMDGTSVQHELARRGVAMPVVVLTGHGEINAAIGAMKAGAVDFLEKPVPKAALIAAIDTALDRLDGLQRHSTTVQQARAAVAALTPRERDVLEGLTRGLSNQGIAQHLAISARTVEIHRANAMVKLDAQSLSQTLRIAFTAGIGDGAG